MANGFSNRVIQQETTHVIILCPSVHKQNSKQKDNHQHIHMQVESMGTDTVRPSQVYKINITPPATSVRGQGSEVGF